MREELLAKLHLQLFDLVTELEVGGNVSLFIFLLMFFCSNIAESFHFLLHLLDLVIELHGGGGTVLSADLQLQLVTELESFQLLLHLLDLVIELHGGGGTVLSADLQHGGIDTVLKIVDLQLFDLVLKMVDLHVQLLNLLSDLDVQLLNLLSELNDGGKGSGSRGRGKGSGSRGRCGDGGTVLERVDLLLQCFDLVLELLLETGGDGGGRVELPD